MTQYTESEIAQMADSIVTVLAAEYSDVNDLWEALNSEPDALDYFWPNNGNDEEEGQSFLSMFRDCMTSQTRKLVEQIIEEGI